MRITDMLLFIAGIIAAIISLIDLLSPHTVKASEGIKTIAIQTLLYLLLGIGGIILVITAIIRYRKNRKFQNEIEDFY